MNSLPLLELRPIGALGSLAFGLRPGRTPSISPRELIGVLEKSRTSRTYREMYKRAFIIGIGSCAYEG